MAVWAEEPLVRSGLVAWLREVLQTDPVVGGDLPTGTARPDPANFERTGQELASSARTVVVAPGPHPTSGGVAAMVAAAAVAAGASVVWVRDERTEAPSANLPSGVAVLVRSEVGSASAARRLRVLLSSGRWSMDGDAGRLRPQHGPAAPHLGERELEVLRLLADGYSTGEIAAALYYSERTVKNVVSAAVQLLSARNRAHAIAIAVRLGLL